MPPTAGLLPILKVRLAMAPFMHLLNREASSIRHTIVIKLQSRYSIRVQPISPIGTRRTAGSVWFRHNGGNLLSLHP